MNDKNTLLDILNQLKKSDDGSNNINKNKEIISIHRYLFDKKEDLIEFNDENINTSEKILGIYIQNIDMVIDNHLELIESKDLDYKKANRETHHMIGQCNDTERKIKQIGIGVLFVQNGRLDDKNKNEFIDILMEFNCPNTVAIKIWSDLNEKSKRHTTTQYHINEKIDSINKKLSKINIEIKRVLPKIKTESKNINKKELIDSIKQLEKQYKNFKP